MNMSLDHAVLTLPRHAYLELRDAAGATLTAMQGSIWVTQEGDTRDMVLRAGDTFRLDRQGLTVVRATELTRLRLRGPQWRESALWRWLRLRNE